MGWKNITEGFQIEHFVRVTSEGICIGSQYIHNIIVIGLDGVVKKRYEGSSNDDLARYQAEMDADPQKLHRLLWLPDTFTESIPVYTYEGGKIIEKFCEELGWPNVTHDGDMMYKNAFSTDKAKVVEWAKQNAKREIKAHEESMRRIMLEHEAATSDLRQAMRNLTKLNADYPDQGDASRAEAAATNNQTNEGEPCQKSSLSVGR